jgi:hypothetical protein
MTTELWCIHIPGPDDLYAAASREAAESMAADHNAAIERHRDRSGWTENDPLFENCLAVVEPWPGTVDEHAADLVKWRQETKRAAADHRRRRPRAAQTEDSSCIG